MAIPPLMTFSGAEPKGLMTILRSFAALRMTGAALRMIVHRDFLTASSF